MGARAAKKAIVKFDVLGTATPLGEVRSFTIETTLGTIDVSTLTTNWKKFISGQAAWTASVELFYDPSDPGQEELSRRVNVGTECEFTFLPFGGDEVYTLDLGGATGGTFVLGDGDTIVTDALDYNSTASEIQTALRAAYDEDGILVAASGDDFVIAFPTEVQASLTLDDDLLTGATDPSVSLHDEPAEYVGMGKISTWSPSAATEDAVGLSIAIQGNGELTLDPIP